MKKLKIFILIITIFFITACGNIYSKLEKELNEKTALYYETFSKGKILGVNNYKISLEAMENNGYNIENFIDNNCSKESYGLVILDLDETGAPIGDYIIETFLICDDYKSEALK